MPSIILCRVWPLLGILILFVSVSRVPAFFPVANVMHTRASRRSCRVDAVQTLDAPPVTVPATRQRLKGPRRRQRPIDPVRRVDCDRSHITWTRTGQQPPTSVEISSPFTAAGHEPLEQRRTPLSTQLMPSQSNSTMNARSSLVPSSMEPLVPSRSTDTGPRHTVDLYIPRAEIDVLMAWANRLKTATRMQLVLMDKEQCILALAQMSLGLERVRADLSLHQPPERIVSTREIAKHIGMRPRDVEGFLKLGLRARSYILMSVHGLVAAVARRYAAVFGVDHSELVQEGYKGVSNALARYDGAKAAASRTTFRTFATIYIVSAVITAARRELQISPTSVPDRSMMRLPAGDKPDGRPALPVGPGNRSSRPRLPVRSGAERSSGGEVAEPSEQMDEAGHGEEREESEWELSSEESAQEEVADSSVRRTRRRKIPWQVTRMSPGQELPFSSQRASKSDLAGVDPETVRPVYEILDDNNKAQAVALFLQRAAKALPQLDMEVLTRVYGLSGQRPVRRTQVAQQLDMNYAAVIRSERRGLQRLREMLHSEQLSSTNR